MASRTAVIISCSEDEARTIRQQAQLQRRTVSGYLLYILMRAVEFEETAVGQWDRSDLWRRSYSKHAPGTRTTVFLRCTTKEASRIRAAAKRRGSTISAYALQALKRSWKVAQVIPDGRSV